MRTLLSTTAIALGLLACNDPSQDPRVCQQSYAFGAYGCAEVAGSVLGSSNQTVANAYISAGANTDPFEFAHTTTDSTGKFRLRLSQRYVMQTGSSDTVSAWFHTVIPVPPQTATASDSALILLTFAPLGKIPETKIVTLHLGTP